MQRPCVGDFYICEVFSPTFEIRFAVAFLSIFSVAQTAPSIVKTDCRAFCEVAFFIGGICNAFFNSLLVQR